VIFGTKHFATFFVSELIKMKKKEAKTSYHIVCALQGRNPPKASSSRRRLLFAATALAQWHQV
jgi:hypothetical protein